MLFRMWVFSQSVIKILPEMRTSHRTERYPMTFQIADKRNPFMGLDNKICKDPVYWCRLHQVWLSDEDVKKKRCNCKKTFDMIGAYRCGNLVKKSIK